MFTIRALVTIAFLFGLALATTPDGIAWLKANKESDDEVVELPSGLQYKVLRSGPDGGLSPKRNSPCECHYRGYLVDGQEFDSSYKRGTPTTFAPNQVIKGWTEAMQLMKEGDKWQLFIPSELAYGESQRGQFITPGALLLFDIEILKVKSGGFQRSEL